MHSAFRLGPVLLALAVAPLACGGDESFVDNGPQTPNDNPGPRPRPPRGDAGSSDPVVDASSEAPTKGIDAGPKTCGGGGGPTGGPADLFPCDSFWYKDVSSYPVAPESDDIIDAIQWGASNTFKIDFGIVFMHEDGTSPRVKFKLDYDDESDHDPVPIPPGGAIEGVNGYNCSGGDCHLIVVDDSTKKLFELYGASNNGGSNWTAIQESVWDLTKSYGPEARGLGCTSADAAGFSIMAGLIGLRETRAGKIEHALRFILPNSRIRKGPSFVAPATHGTSATSSASGPPYGTRLRLKASFDESRVKSSGGKAVVRALKKYGMLLADGGQIALTAEGDRIQKKLDPSMTWDGVLKADDLDMIKPSDFEVVDFGPIQKVKGCKLL